MKVFIAESSYLIKEGLKALISKSFDIDFVGNAESSGELIPQLVDAKPDVLFVNYASPLILGSDVELIINAFPNIKVIAITDRPDPMDVVKYMRAGIDGHLLYSCSEEEIKESLFSVVKNERFFCGKVLEVIDKENSTKTFTCEGIRLSKREIEVIELVAQGFSNKEIAEGLFLSVHTVLTHRKNLMQKLGLKNTAGLVVYAVQNGMHKELN